MKKEQNNKVYIIDAQGKSLGRLASQIAVLLRGKNSPHFMPNKDAGNRVIVKNIDKIKFTGKKLENKNYFRFTGYLGNLKKMNLRELLEKKGPQEALKLAVKGMLPKNRLRARFIKRLSFE